MKHAIAILTRCTSKETEFRLTETLKSLIESGYPGTIYVVDDASTYMRDWSLIQDMGAWVLLKAKHGGISRGKNSCINPFSPAS